MLMAVKKVGTSVVSSSFNEDNFARRMLKRIIDTVNNNADELSNVSGETAGSIGNIEDAIEGLQTDVGLIELKVSPLQLWGTYTSEVGETFPTDGITKTDFTKVDSMPELAGASAILIVISGIAVGAYDYGNKAFSYTISGENSSTIAKASDNNVDMSFECFKLSKELSGECVIEVSGRAPSYTNNPTGFYKKLIGLDTGVVLGSINIQDFKITAGTNRLTQRTPLNISVYVAY